MHPRTIATLDKLREAHWFANVGVRDTEVAEVLTSWVEAVESCTSASWQDLCLEAANQYRERLVERSPKRFSSWNHIVGDVKPATQKLVREKLGQVIEENNLPKGFLDAVDWDILHVCMEAEYADIFPPGILCEPSLLVHEGTFSLWLARWSLSEGATHNFLTECRPATHFH